MPSPRTISRQRLPNTTSTIPCPSSRHQPDLLNAPFSTTSPSNTSSDIELDRQDRFPYLPSHKRARSYQNVPSIIERGFPYVCHHGCGIPMVTDGTEI